MTTRRLVHVNLAAATAGAAAYLGWWVTGAHWFLWLALPLALVGFASLAPLIVRATTVAGVGPIATAGALGALLLSAVSWVVSGTSGVSSMHRVELGALTLLLEWPWFVIYGIRLRRARIGRTALALVIVQGAGIADRPFISSVTLAWVVYLGAFALYVAWLLQLPDAVRLTAEHQAQGAGARGRLWFVPGYPSRGWLTAHAVWLLLALLALAALEQKGDRLGDLWAAYVYWLIGAWILAAASACSRALRGRRRSRIAGS